MWVKSQEIHCFKYASVESISYSDHKPIYATFSLAFKRKNIEKVASPTAVTKKPVVQVEEEKVPIPIKKEKVSPPKKVIIPKKEEKKHVIESFDLLGIGDPVPPPQVKQQQKPAQSQVINRGAYNTHIPKSATTKLIDFDF